MPPCHRVGDQRACGAVTVGTGLNTKVLIEGVPAAVQGDLNSHSMLGPLISIASGLVGGKQVLIQGIPLIVAMVDQSGPDVIGLIQHVTNFPTPMTGSTKVHAYNSLGGFGGGLGNIVNGFGNLINGELVAVAGQIVGQIHNFTNVGGNSGLAILKNLQGMGSSSLSGQTLVGQTSGNQFVMGTYQITNQIVSSSYVTDENGEQVVIDTGELVTL